VPNDKDAEWADVQEARKQGRARKRAERLRNGAGKIEAGVVSGKNDRKKKQSARKGSIMDDRTETSKRDE
jgi:hypothetical protein